MSMTRLFLPCTSSSLANFLAWAKPIHDAIVATGWAQAADSGQVNFDTLSSISTNTTFFKIYYPNDTLQSSYPFYLRVDYWVGSSNQAGIKVAIGTGSNGSGTLTGNVSSTCDMSVSFPAVSATLYQCIVSGTSSRLLIGLWLDYNSNSAGNYFGFERSISPTTGLYTGDYMYVACNLGQTSGNGNVAQCVSKAGQAWTITTREYRAAIAMPWGSTSAIYNGKIHTSPFFPMCGQVAMGSTLFQVVKYQDIGSTDGIIFKVTMYGTDISYQRWGTAANGNSAALHNGDGNCRIGLRID